MPRTGSSCVDSVCLVPNDTSFRTIASTRAGSTSRRIARSSLSGGWARGGRPAPPAPDESATAGDPASAAPPAAAATVAVRNVRREFSVMLPAYTGSTRDR
jgi:hypothetical protein